MGDKRVRRATLIDYASSWKKSRTEEGDIWVERVMSLEF